MLLLVVAAALLATAAGAPTANYTVTYADGTRLLARTVDAAGATLQLTVVPPGASTAFPHYDLTVPLPPLPPGAGFTVDAHAAYVVLRTPRAYLNISTRVPTTQLLAPDGTLLSGEPQAYERQDPLQCGNGRGGPLPQGCLRMYRTLQPDEAVFGFGQQSFAVNHAGSTKV